MKYRYVYGGGGPSGMLGGTAAAANILPGGTPALGTSPFRVKYRVGSDMFDKGYKI